MKYLLLFFLFLLEVPLLAQSFKKQYLEYAKQQDTAQQLSVLQKWEKSNPEDPEMYVAYYNYFVRKSMKEVLSLDPVQRSEESISVMDSATQTVGYLNSMIIYQEDILKQGFNYINQGIARYPTRLDMRLGKVYMLGKVEDFESFSREIIQTIHYADSIKHKWLWSENKAAKDPKNLLLNAVQDYVKVLYDTQDHGLLENMKQISNTVLLYNPNHVESLSNIAIVHLLDQEYDQALVLLLKALELAPQDYIVLGNIAQAYKLKGDKKNAIKYYELVIEYGEEGAKEYAKEQIEMMNDE
jgi:tetratricopeptide (TPR) repeat protein